MIIIALPLGLIFARILTDKTLGIARNRIIHIISRLVLYHSRSRQYKLCTNIQILNSKNKEAFIMLTAVTGINWGDEGKGRVIDLLAEHADIVVRYQGGNNAGHTVVNKQGKFILNLLPSGILHPDVVCVLGDGMVIDLNHLSNEIAQIRTQDVSVSPKNLKLSTRATISMPWHKIQDELEEERLSKSGAAFGSTKRGIAYAYSDKYRKKNNPSR